MTDLQKQQITQMREQGRTYSEISESLSIAVGTIKAFCSRKAPKASAVPVPVVQATITEGRCKRCGEPLINTPGASAENLLFFLMSEKILAGA